MDCQDQTFLKKQGLLHSYIDSTETGRKNCLHKS